MSFTLTRAEAESIFLPAHSGNLAPLSARCTPATRFTVGASSEPGEGFTGVYRSMEEYMSKFVRGLEGVVDMGTVKRVYTAADVVGARKWVEEFTLEGKTLKGADYLTQ